MKNSALWKVFVVLAFRLTICALVVPCAAGAAEFAPRVVNNSETVVLKGNVHPLARPEFQVGVTGPSLPMERMILSLRLTPNKQAELEKLLADQQDPASPNFHHWLTPEEFGAQYGPQPEDIAAITIWLMSQGFTVDEVAKGRTWINFSGTVANVESAFHTQIHDFIVEGQLRHANASDPSIPLALADVVSGIVTLHNIPIKSMTTGVRPLMNGVVQPDATTTSGNSHAMSPGDFATIYNVNPLYKAGIDGSGTSIAIVGRTHPSSTNWADFRSTMGLSINPPQVIVNGTDPGDVSAAEDGEADLDVEWSGAVARNATIKFIVSNSTSSTDGVTLSAQYIVDNNLADVMSTSFGLCESLLGTTEMSFTNNLWAQAAAQGITSFVSSGDSGAAGCDDQNTVNFGSGRAVNGLASTPYNVAVGGTQFNEGSGSYWNSTNGPGLTSAISYIPEIAWNESGAVSNCPPDATCSGLWATGGGASTTYGKPSWQVAPGVPADGRRDLPDVSLSAAGHDGYLVQTTGGQGPGLYSVGGTSASSPSFAGLMALIVQKNGQRQGNANPLFYQLANAQYGSGGATVFHDIISGSNSVPGVTGYSADTGYDLATGLGSVDANALVNNWANNGSCGSANGVPSGVAPPAELCSSGTPSAVTTGTTQWIWTCAGSNGGTTASCSAPRTDIQPPTSPAGLSATAISPGQINLAWTASTDNVGVTAYRVYRDGVLIATLGNVTSYRNTGLTASTRYSYSVQACDAGGNCSAQSAVAPAITLVAIPGTGSCGLANGVISAFAPSAGLCSSGTPGAVTTGTTQWAWTCAGSAGGPNAACSAPRVALPTCTLTASAGTINLGGSVILTAACSPAATTYVWTPAAGLVAGPANTATVTPTAAGTYQYSVTGSNAGGVSNTASTSVTVAPGHFISQSDCLFNWAERTYPSLFAPAGTISNALAPYYYRFYLQTNAYLATSSADSHVYYLGPLSNNSIHDMGALSSLLSTAGCQ